MAYIPPHKRHPRDIDKPTPTAELLAPLFNTKLNLRPSAPRFIRKDLKPSGRKEDRSGKITFAVKTKIKWFSIGSSDVGNLFPSCLHLVRYSVPSIERRWGLRPLALMNSNLSQGNRTMSLVFYLLVACDYAIDKTELPTETTLRQLKRSFYTNVSNAYMDYVTEKVIPLIGVEFKEEKDIYEVKLLDVRRPFVTILCKCTALPVSNNLKLCKVELNRTRHLFEDISCLKQKIDLRMVLYAKKIRLEKLTNDEMEGILDLINSAVLDQDVMGGLRWPLEKASSGDRFRLDRVWHTVAKSYVSPVVRLKLRNVDRYDFGTSVGEASKEVILKLKQVTSELLYDVVFRLSAVTLMQAKAKIFLRCGV
ncbi:uncharacterized protein LOC105434728 [Cucumis sativus]|uniref:uncharacterized protein LOC105434728 n=1 Tax=Cucumis sativus TaxID=3659 RepID=UPI0012F491B8|nr:uncharacterized protein LOC105434728 [Cucumis sativus]